MFPFLAEACFARQLVTSMRRGPDVQTPDDNLLAEIEDFAARLARRAGGVLGQYFSDSMEVCYKNEGRTATQ